MEDAIAFIEPSPRAENSRGSARPGSARSVRSSSNSVNLKSDKLQTTGGLGTETLPLSARDAGSTGGAASPPPAPSREMSKVSSLPRSVVTETAADGHPLSIIRANSNMASPLLSTRSQKSNSANHRVPAGAAGAGTGGLAESQDLRSEAMPWNELKQSSRPPSVVNSIAPYVGHEASPRGGSPRESTKAHSRPHTPSGPGSVRSVPVAAQVGTVSRAGSVTGAPVTSSSSMALAAVDAAADTVLAGSPSISRESSKLASRPASAAVVPPLPLDSLGSSPWQQYPPPPPESQPSDPQLQPQPQSQRQQRSASASRAVSRPMSAAGGGSVAARSVGRKSVGNKSLGGLGAGAVFEPLPWSTLALSDFRQQMKRCHFELLDPADTPLSARMDQVFSLPYDLWPVLPPGALYCLEEYDPRVGFGYLQHTDFPDTKVRVGTYFGKWGRHLVDFVVAWQPIPRHEAAWQPGGAKQPPQPWEPRQVVAHTTNGEYQYANTRMRFRGPQSTAPGAPTVDWCDAHGVDLLDTKAGNETAPRNSDKDRDAHLLDPPRPNTWGEMARRPLIGNLRSRGGGAYVHHVNYDYSGLRTTCGRRVPAGYFFTLVPNAPAKTPAVPGAPPRASSVGRSLAGGRSRAASLAATAATAPGGETSSNRLDSVASRLATFQSSQLMASMSQSVQALLNGILDGPSGAAAGRSANGNRTSGGGAAGAVSRPMSAESGSGPASRRSSFGSAAAAAPKMPQMLESFRSLGAAAAGVGVGALAGIPSAAQLSREASRLPPTSSPSLFALAPRQRWRTYDIPFHHPIHTTRAQDLGAAAAAAAGRGVRAFSDAAAVLEVAEQELRLPRAFMPGPLVVETWEDVPRLYAEHMAAARALMPVTELDTFGSSKLHQLVYHLQAAATLEFDRLDAKLALLPQMARLGRKSAEIDAWLQVVVEHATYLYDKIAINDTARWPPPLTAAAAAALGAAARPASPSSPQPPPSAQPSSLHAGQSQGLVPAAAFRRSVTFSQGAPLLAPNPSTAPAASGSALWAFPEPLAGTSFAERSALNVAVQRKERPAEQQVPAHRVTMEEWSGVTKVMDTCRHAILYDHWIRLRPLMTGSALPGHSLSTAASRAGSTYFTSDAGATIFELGADPAGPAAQLDATFSHGHVNKEVLDFLQQDMAAMSAPNYTPPAPGPEATLPPTRGYHGPGPLPAALVAEAPQVHRPARIRGADDTPLPPWLAGADLWNVTSKADQATSPEGPSPLDVGALRFSQMSIHQLQAAKGFAASRQAEVRRSIMRAMGQDVWDESSVPEYGSDIAEGPEGEAAWESGGATDGGSRPRGSRRHNDINPPVEPLAPGTATQTAEDLQGPSAMELAAEAALRAREAEEAAEMRRQLLIGNGGKTREQMLEEALQAAEAAILSLHSRPVGAAAPGFVPTTPKVMTDDGEVLDAAWKPYGRGQSPYTPGGDPMAPQRDPRQLSRAVSWYKRSDRPRGSESYGKGPEPLALMKVTAEPSSLSEMEAEIAVEDMPPAKKEQGKSGTSFGAMTVGVGGLVDYETAMARRRAIAGAELAHDKSDYLDPGEAFNLFVTYCNLGGHPELVDMLQRAINAPVSVDALRANAAATGNGGRAGGRNAAAAAAAAAADAEAEAVRQRIRATAWLLGVSWRRITNETYSSFLSRVLGWPQEAAGNLHRTRCTQIIAKALVRGHDITRVPK